MMHLAAYYKSVDPAAALTKIDAITDQAITINNNDIRVPKDIANLLGEAFLSAATTPLYGELQSPSLRQLAYQDVAPVASAAKFGDSEQIQWHGDSPRALAAAESLEAYIDATGGAAAANYALVWLGDGPPKASPGKIFSVRATAAVTLSAGEWENGAITFESVLPSGTFQIVGCRAVGANLIAARFAFVGGGYRPGVPADPSDQTNYFPGFRMGRMGVFGQFDTDYPPTMDFLGATDTSQKLIIDLIKSG